MTPKFYMQIFRNSFLMSNSGKTVLLQSLNVLAFAVTVIVNALASSLALNGVTTAEVSDLYFTLVTPAGYVFSIWGLIYILLLIFAVFQALPSQREKTVSPANQRSLYFKQRPQRVMAFPLAL